VITGTWADLVTMLSSELSPEDVDGGWTEELRTRWRVYAEQFRDLDIRFLPSTAAGLVDMFNHDGITSGPIVAAVSAARGGIPGVGTTAAVALAVRRAVAQTRKLGFTGRAPTLRRELPDGTVHMVNFQRMNSGVTGREPSFTVNLNVVPGALRRAWAATGHSFGRIRLQSAVNVGVAGRLGILAPGHRGPDVWWHPSTEEEAEEIAAEVVEQLRTTGLDWLQRLSDRTRLSTSSSTATPCSLSMWPPQCWSSDLGTGGDSVQLRLSETGTQPRRPRTEFSGTG
jgi:hypothetical protein